MNDTTRACCAHLACHCEVSDGRAYCSEACRERVEGPLADASTQCPCGHEACVAQAADRHAADRLIPGSESR